MPQNTKFKMRKGGPEKSKEQACLGIRYQSVYTCFFRQFIVFCIRKKVKLTLDLDSKSKNQPETSPKQKRLSYRGLYYL